MNLGDIVPRTQARRPPFREFCSRHVDDFVLHFEALHFEAQNEGQSGGRSGRIPIERMPGKKGKRIANGRIAAL